MNIKVLERLVHWDRNSKTQPLIAIIVWTIIVFMSTVYIIDYCTIQYSRLPESIIVHLEDSRPEQWFALPVETRLNIDTNRRVVRDVAQELRDKEDPVKKIMFHQNPAFMEWKMLLALLMTVVAASAPVFTRIGCMLYKEFKLTKKQFLKGCLFTGFFIVFALLSDVGTVGLFRYYDLLGKLGILLRHPELLIKGFLGLALLFLIPTIIVAFLLVPAADNAMQETGGKLSSDGGAEKINSRRELKNLASHLDMLVQTLQNALQLLATVIVITVLTSAAMREAIISTVEIFGFDPMPHQVSKVYGLYFSLLLLIIYFPIFQYLKLQYQGFRNMVSHYQDESGDTDGKWAEEIIGMVDIKRTNLDNIRIGLTVLSPFISSFLPGSLHLFN